MRKLFESTSCFCTGQFKSYYKLFREKAYVIPSIFCTGELMIFSIIALLLPNLVFKLWHFRVIKKGNVLFTFYPLILGPSDWTNLIHPLKMSFWGPHTIVNCIIDTYHPMPFRLSICAENVWWCTLYPIYFDGIMLTWLVFLVMTGCNYIWITYWSFKLRSLLNFH